MERMFFGQMILVGLGGFFGSGLRFALGGWVQRLFPYSQLPLGTLTVNVVGCLFIGFLGGLAEQRQLMDTGLRLFLLVGVLGGFTTFSTFAYESLALGQDSRHGLQQRIRDHQSPQQRERAGEELDRRDERRLFGRGRDLLGSQGLGDYARRLLGRLLLAATRRHRFSP